MASLPKCNARPELGELVFSAKSSRILHQVGIWRRLQLPNLPTHLKLRWMDIPMTILDATDEEIPQTVATDNEARRPVDGAWRQYAAEILQRAPDIIFIADSAGRVQFMNPA